MKISRNLALLCLCSAFFPLPPALTGGDEPKPDALSVEALQSRVAALEEQLAALKKLAYKPTLGECMTSVQSRHAKLWCALAAENWSLAAFELHELDETLETVAKFHPTHRDAPLPLKEMIQTGLDPALKQLQKAVQTGDKTRYPKAFDELSQACNACHRATNHGYNVVKRPTGPPFSNQEFAPLPSGR